MTNFLMLPFSLIKRTKNFYLRYGFIATIKKILTSLLLVFGLKLERANYNRERYKIERKIFYTRKLTWCEKGYWFVDPKIKEDELNLFYEKVYWGSRINYGSTERDFIHWYIIKELLGFFFKEKKTILNFGAGHGGISNIFWTHNHEIINVEPSNLPQSFKERWVNYKNIDKVPNDCVDFFYGSHSLEHVADLDIFLDHVKRILKKNSYVFWEVPNGKHSKSGPVENRIHAPHTYYFTKDFFDKEFKSIILNDYFEDSFGSGNYYNWKDYKDENGQLIRVIGSYS